MVTGYKEKILELREKGYSYGKISQELSCSKAIISYHCTKNNINDIGLRRSNLTETEIDMVKEYYITHTIKETGIAFNISNSTVKRYVKKKRKLLTKEEKIKSNYKNVKTLRVRNKIKAVKLLGGSCKLCGYNKCVEALDFHHINPNEKDFGISMNLNRSWNKIETELIKCILVCSNCHREIHNGLVNLGQ